MPEVEPLRRTDPQRLGAFRLTGRLGEGGHAVVYLGESLTGEAVAVKLLHARLEEPSARAAFAKALAAAQVVDPFCTARVLVADMDGDVPYIVSECVQGPSLRSAVETHGPRSGDVLNRLAITTATALAAIHQAGVVHRDLKPGNVMLGPEGARVVDFGLARALGADGPAPAAVIGTPAYMAPEQFAGRALTAAVDVWAWGATIVYASCGRPPFGEDAVQAVAGRILHEQPDLGTLDGRLRHLVLECLVKDPRERPSSQYVLMRLLSTDEGAPVAPFPPVPAVAHRPAPPHQGGRPPQTGPHPIPSQTAPRQGAPPGFASREVATPQPVPHRAVSPPGAPPQDTPYQAGSDHSGSYQSASYRSISPQPAPYQGAEPQTGPQRSVPQQVAPVDPAGTGAQPIVPGGQQGDTGAPQPDDSGIQVRIGRVGPGGPERRLARESRQAGRRTRVRNAGLAAALVILVGGVAAALFLWPGSAGSQTYRGSEDDSGSPMPGTDAGPVNQPRTGVAIKVNATQGEVNALALAAVNAGTTGRPLRQTGTPAPAGQRYAYGDYVLTNTLGRSVLMPDLTSGPADLFVKRALVAETLRPRCMPQAGAPADSCTLTNEQKIIGLIGGSGAPTSQDGDQYMPAGASYLVRIQTTLPVSSGVTRSDLGLYVWQALYVPDRVARPIPLP